MSRIPRIVSIIEDDDSVRRALGRLVRSAGLDAETFPTAEEYLHAGAAAASGCLILDYRLPGMSGLELCARLKAEGRKEAVVFISAYGDEQLGELALQAGALAFLAKPFAEQALLDAVARALRGGGAEGAATVSPSRPSEAEEGPSWRPH